MKLFIFLFAFSLLIQSCATLDGTKKIAKEWCTCMEKSEGLDPSSIQRTCDSISESMFFAIAKEKYQEALEKKTPIDSVREYIRTTQLEYQKLTGECRKSED